MVLFILLTQRCNDFTRVYVRHSRLPSSDPTWPSLEFFLFKEHPFIEALIAAVLGNVGNAAF